MAATRWRLGSAIIANPRCGMLCRSQARVDMSRESRLYGAVEAGGTKFNCAIADETGAIRAQTRVPTQDPATTLSAVREFFRGAAGGDVQFAAIGIGAFGPVVLNKHSARYGFIGRTPKAGWSNTDLAGMLAREFSCPVGFDTDVNAAALGEHRWGAGQRCRQPGLCDGRHRNRRRCAGGRRTAARTDASGNGSHAAAPRHALDADFAGICPFHRDCLEGVASGPAIVARSGAQLWQSGWGPPAVGVGGGLSRPAVCTPRAGGLAATNRHGRRCLESKPITAPRSVADSCTGSADMSTAAKFLRTLIATSCPRHLASKPAFSARWYSR